MARVDETDHRAHLALSNQSTFVYVEGIAKICNIQFVQAELIAKEVRRVFAFAAVLFNEPHRLLAKPYTIDPCAVGFVLQKP